MKVSRAILFATLLGWAFGAGAQGYPARPIAIVVAFSAGGPTDTIARILAARMTSAIGQTVVVENTTGAGTPAHVSAVYFQNVTGTKPQIIHYRGAAPATQDLLAGQIDFMFDQAANALPQLRGGKVRAYAVTAKTRLLAAPDIPTVDEAGLPGFYMAVWHGIWAPKATPPRKMVADHQAGGHQGRIAVRRVAPAIAEILAGALPLALA